MTLTATPNVNKQKAPATTVALEQALTSTMTDKRIEILRATGHLGSISKAARSTGVSYKAAWQAIETLTNLAGVSLMEKVVGGAGGGGARLTSAGEQLLTAADYLARARAAALSALRGDATQALGSIERIARIGLRTSMRNQLPCLVSRIEQHGGTARIWLELSDGQHLSSRITRESLELLDLKEGMPVLALCKATAVTIAPTIVAVGDVNLLKGRVAKRQGKNSDGQISLMITDGLQISGFASPDAQLKIRQAATAAIADSAIVVGLPN